MCKHICMRICEYHNDHDHDHHFMSMFHANMDWMVWKRSNESRIVLCSSIWFGMASVSNTQPNANCFVVCTESFLCVSVTLDVTMLLGQKAQGRRILSDSTKGEVGREQVLQELHDYSHLREWLWVIFKEKDSDGPSDTSGHRNSQGKRVCKSVGGIGRVG